MWFVKKYTLICRYFFASRKSNEFVRNVSNYEFSSHIIINVQQIQRNESLSLGKQRILYNWTDIFVSVVVKGSMKSDLTLLHLLKL